MPWRRPPRAAVFSLLSAGALTAAAAGLRTPEPPLPAPPETIDQTLTRDAAGCAGVSSNVWHPLSGLDYTGRLRITLPAQFGGAIALYVGAAIPLDLEVSTVTGDPVQMDQERLIIGPGVRVPTDFWIEDGTPLDAPPHVSRVSVDAAGEVPRTVLLSLGRRAPRVVARAVGYASHARVQVCADPIAPHEVYYATGWYGQEREPGEGPVRWMRQHGAVMVSSADDGAARIRLRLAPAAGADGIDVTIRVNDVLDLPPIRLAAGFQDYVLEVPDHAWVAGTNELFFSTAPTGERGSSNPPGSRGLRGSQARSLALSSLHVQ